MPLEVTKFRPFEKNTLRGFATVRLTGVNLEIRNITIHEKDGKRWVSMPSKPYEADGETKYSYIVKFYDNPTWEKFQSAVLKEIDRLKPATAEPVQESDDQPF